MSTSERRFAYLTGVAALLAIILPGILARLVAGEGSVYGGVLLNPLDGNSYLAKMYLGWRGDWVFQLPYTPETGQGAFFNLYYILGGHFARITGLGLVTVYEGMRVAGSAALLAALWGYFSRTLVSPFERKAAFLIASLCIGSGWVLLFFDALPPDFWIAEAYPLLAMLANPHFPLALALIVFLATPRPGNRPPYLRDVLVSLALGIVSPFGVPIALLPWAGQGLVRLIREFREARQFPRDLLAWTESRKLAAIFLGGMPVIVYALIAIRSDPLLAAWDSQNLTPTPSVLNLLLSISPALVLAVFVRREERAEVFAGWAVLSLALVLFPHALQRRFLMGIQIPLAGLAAIGLNVLRSRSRRAARIAGWLFVPGPVIFILVILTGVFSQNPLLYMSRDEAAAFDWIRNRTEPDSLVMASPEIGMWIPAHTGRRVLYGHPFETLRADEQKDLVEAFYGPLPLVEAEQLIGVRGVDYIFFGPREQALGGLPAAPGLKLVFQVGEVRIYAAGE